MKAQNSTVTVGVGTTSYNLMPVNTDYNYGLTEQIYTAAEIGQSGTIYSLAFYNSSESVTRNIDIYMVNTDKSSFSDGYDWVAVSSSDLVFSGEVDLVNDMWSTIELTQPFYYSGSGNLLIAVNDNTGNTTSSILFFSVFNAPGQAICATSDDVNCNPFSPGIYGYVVDYKNPIQLGFEPVVCHKPTNLALSDVGANSAVLNWEQPGGGDHWYVQYTTNEYFYFFYEEHVSSTSVTLHNLHPNSTYYVRVANECDSSSISPWCISPSFITTESACPTPSNLTATNVSSTYVNLTWNQPDGGNTWLVEFNTNPSFSSSSATVVHDTSMLLTNLTPNTTYYVHVRNYCDNLNSSHWSNTVSFTTTDETSTCLAPTDLYAFNISANGASIMWNQPDVGANWMVQYSTNADFSNADEITITTRGWYLNGIDPSTHYYVRVAQVCSSSISPWCETAEFTTLASPCATPTGLTVSNISYNGADLNWILTGSSGSCEIEYSTNPDFTSSTTVNTGTTSFSLTNLDPITTYYVRVRLFCGIAAHGSWSNTVSFTTTGGYIACLPPINLTVLNIGSNGAGLSWEQPGDGEQWMIQYSTNANFSNSNEDFVGGETGWYLYSLEPSTHYYVRVAQVCGSSMSSWSNTEEFTTTGSPCLAPTDLEHSNVSYNGADLTWSQPGNGNEWQIEYSTDPNFTSSEFVSSYATYFPLTVLYPITTYYVRVRQFCGTMGSSSWSNTTSFTTTGGYIACLPPINLTVLNIGSDGAGVSWEQPGDGEQWTIQYSTNADFSNANELTIGGTSWYLYSLEPGTHYYVRVAQVCSFSDMSSWSETEEFTTTGGGNAETEIIDFETATLSEFPFDNDPTYLWSITEAPNDCNNCGNYCMHSGNYGWDNTTSMISATYDFSDDGYISFDAKCAGEATNYDVCEFYIDGNMQFFRDVASWENYMYTVSAGTHTFTWLFRKDQSVSNTGEGFYVDNIVFGVTSPAVCLAPTDLEYSNVSYNGADLTWSQPGDGNEWQIEYSTDPDFTSSEFMSSGATYFPLTVLYPITTYYVRVRQFCGTMTPSAWSNTVSFTTTGGIIIIPDIIDFETGDFSQYTFGQDAEHPWIITEAPNDCNNCGAYCMRSGNAGVANSTSTIEITYDFSENGHIAFDAKCAGEPDNYDVCEFYIDGEQQFSHAILDWNYYLYDVPAGTHTFTWTYSKDISVDNGDDGFFVDNIDFVLGSSVPCLVPTNLTASNIGYNGADVTWSQPGVGSEWHVQCSANPDFYPLLSDNFVNDASFPMTGLDPGTTYYVRVANFCGTMGASDWVSTSFTTLESSCLAPTDLTVTLVGNDFFGLTWNQPGGGDRWIIERSTDPDFSSFTHSLCIGTNITQQSIAPGTYYARVRNYCSNMNISSCSNTVTFTVGIEILCPTPANFTASEIGINNATLSWDADSQVDGWVVEYGTAADFSDAITVTTTANSLDLTGLATTTPYYARVKADCSNGFKSNWANCHFNTSFCAATNQCIISYELHDGGDDGWTGAAINVVDVATDFLLDTWTIGDGDFASGSLSVCEGREIKFQWVYGEYDEETSYTVYDFNGNVIFSGSDFMNPSAYYYTPYCSAAPCPVPTGLAVNNVASNSAQVNWSGEGNTYALRYRVIGDDWTEYPSVNPPFQFSSLTPGTDYELQVRANCWSIGTSEWSDPVTFTTVACPAPTGLTVTNIETHSAKLSWTENGTSTFWRIRLNYDNDHILVVSSIPEKTLSGLSTGTEYTVQVSTFCDGMWSDWSAPLNFTTLPCQVPTALAVSDITKHSAQLNWTENGTATEWQICLNGDEGNLITYSYNHYQLDDLDPETHYTVKVRANCDDVWSDWSTPVTFTTPLGCSVPTELTVSNISYHSARLTWSGEGESYTLQYRATDEDWSSINNVTPPYSLAGLQSDVTYEVRLKADCGSDGTSDWCDPVTFTTDVPCFIPTNISATNVTSVSAFLAWNNVQDEYNIRYRVAGDSWIDIDGVQPPYILTGLTPGTDYEVQVQSVCGSLGVSAWSDPVTFSTVPCPTPIQLSVDNVTKHTAQLSWTETGNATSWQVCINGDEENLVTAGTNPRTLYNLDAGTEYTVKMRAQCGIGWSDWSNEVTFTTEVACTTPTSLAVSNITMNSADLTWLGENVTHYVQYKVSTDADWIQLQGNSPYYLDGLQHDVTYNVRVMANCGIDGTSDWSDTVTFTTSSCPVPTGLVVTDVAAHSAVLSWTENGSANVWQIRFNYDDTDTKIVYDNPQQTLVGLAAATDYIVQVRARCGANWNEWSEWSEPLTFTTDIVHIVPTSLYISGVTVFCHGDSVVLQANADQEVTYVWSTGETGQQITVSVAGDYSVTATSSTGEWIADTVTVTEWETYSATTYDTICPSDFPYMWRGIYIYTAGTRSDTLQTQHGCDSVVTLVLTVNPTYTVTDTQTVCQNELPYVWNGVSFYEAKTKHVTLQTVDGCDSVVYMTLNVNPTYNTPIEATICQGTSYNFFGQPLEYAGEYTHTLQSVNGCDSVITLTLNINPMYSTEVYDTICEGESYDFFGQTLTQAGGYIHNAQTVNGCDSVITLTLTVNHPAHTAVTETACGSYSWHGTTYTTSGTYLFSHEDINGCTQVDTLHLTINPADVAEFTETACESFTWNEETFTVSGDYTRTLTNAAGCDSVVTLHLTIHPTYNTPVSADICQGGSYDFFGQALTQTGTYTHTLQTVHGCDSVITLSLTVHTMMLTQIADTICEGTSYPFFDQTLTLSGVYAHTLQTVYGCDSLITLALTVLPASHTDLTAESCSSYEWNGVTYTASGDYSVNYTAANGCDSIVTLHLTILPVQNTAVSADICQGGNYDFFGQALTQTGTYTHTLTSANGCDSVITLSLTVHSMMLTQIADTICEGTSYPFFDQTLTQTGVYAHALQTVYGCDSLITLSLTVLPASHTDLSAEGCDSYEWNGETYTQSGDYSVSYTAANGCDSIVTLHLTISHSVTSEFTIETNEGCYTWNGTEYCQSGDYTQTLQTVAGCDSVVTLHLTVGVGIEDHDLNAAIFLTPNPATNICRINGLETEPISVDLYDMNGKLVRRPNTTEFDVSTLPTGIYMVRVTTNDNRIINLKMVKQ